MTWILDRVDRENAVAYLEGPDETFERVDIARLSRLKHGSVYHKTPQGWEYDEQATLQRAQYMQELTRHFFRRKGDK